MSVAVLRAKSATQAGTLARPHPPPSFSNWSRPIHCAREARECQTEVQKKDGRKKKMNQYMNKSSRQAAAAVTRGSAAGSKYCFGDEAPRGGRLTGSITRVSSVDVMYCNHENTGRLVARSRYGLNSAPPPPFISGSQARSYFCDMETS